MIKKQICVKEPNYGLQFYDGVFTVENGILMVYEEYDVEFGFKNLKAAIKDFTKAWY